MKHLQSYNNFSKVNEELTSGEKRAIRFIPQAILGFLGKNLLGIYPMLNLRWREMKRATTGLKDSPLITGNRRVMKHELIKTSIDDLPENKLKLSMFLRDWNVYLAKDYKSTGGGEHGKIERDVIYISKDEIKQGDTYRGYRLSDSDIYSEKLQFEGNEKFIMSKNSKGKLYPDKLKDPANFPIIIMVAKYDEIDKVKEIESYVGDICLELEDELLVDVKIYFSKEQDSLSLDIKPIKSLIYSTDIDSLLISVTERIKDYLKYKKYNFDYILKYRVKGPLFYNGNAGRFGTEVIPTAKEYSRRDPDFGTPLWDEVHKTLNVEKLSPYSDDVKLDLTGSDLDTLLSDLDNCTKCKDGIYQFLNDTPRNRTMSNNWKEINKVTQIELKQVLVEFKNKKKRW
jgi:hypothetical protein